MSTRATIAMGEGWHLYEELLDNTIHLEMGDPIEVNFEASPDSIDVTIPEEVLDSVDTELVSDQCINCPLFQEARSRCGDSIWECGHPYGRGELKEKSWFDQEKKVNRTEYPIPEGCPLHKKPLFIKLSR